MDLDNAVLLCSSREIGREMNEQKNASLLNVECGWTRWIGCSVKDIMLEVATKYCQLLSHMQTHV